MDKEIRLRKRYKFSKEISLELNQLLSLDNWHALIAVVYDYSFIGLGILFYIFDPYFYPLSIIIIGSRQRALSTLLHEAAHSRLAKSKTLNYFIGTFLSGYLILWEYYTFTRSHVKDHHLYLGDRLNDPDYVYHQETGLYDFQSRKDFISKYIIKPFLLGTVFSYLKYIFINRASEVFKHKKQAFIMLSYLLSIVLLAGYLGFIKHLIILWLIPLFTIFPIIGWFIELSEHYPLVAEHDVDLYMTRNRFSSFLEAMIFSIHCENLHLVHHLRPGIPFWNLKNAHRILLKDKEYKNLNSKMGGIFYSSNNQEPFISKITDKNRNLFSLGKEMLIKQINTRSVR
ncbi:MAG: fatty acid desaturase family protein [Candidatus Paracaedimonas acanthamoebae]|uniref:Fatty acid desaturase family protein n=1 Tax=Candidatus Paracaedimonas acanthamoebae TaxID=244581 RepID=A0A8J7PW63_9PROT|nr:fatty acid desaturase family protein [Candidatus Paracaedimonas acanthamoebae]